MMECWSSGIEKTVKDGSILPHTLLQYSITPIGVRSISSNIVLIACIHYLMRNLQTAKILPLPFIPSSPRRRLYEPEATRGGEISVFRDVQLSVCKFLLIQ
jgi:hypothetical protein